MTFVEQRKHERVTVDIDVYWGWTYDCPYRGRIISLSIGGYFLRTDESAPRGTPVYITFWLPEQKTLCGEVRYHLERMGVGAEFVGLSRDDESRLAALVDYFRAATPQ